MVRGAVFTLVLAAGLALGVGHANAGEPFAVKVAKQKDGPYKVDIRANIGAGETASFWWRVKNNGDEPDLELVFDDADTSDQNGFTTRWFKAGKNVSSEVEGDGREFRIDPGQKKYFNAKTTAGTPTEPSCLAGQASIPSVTSDLSSVSINDETCSF